MFLWRIIYMTVIIAVVKVLVYKIIYGISSPREFVGGLLIQSISLYAMMGYAYLGFVVFKTMY